MRQPPVTVAGRMRSAAYVILSLTVPCLAPDLRSSGALAVFRVCRAVLRDMSPWFGAVPARRQLVTSGRRRAVVRMRPWRAAALSDGPWESFISVRACRRDGALSDPVLPGAHTTLLEYRPSLPSRLENSVTLRNEGSRVGGVAPRRPSASALDAAVPCHTFHATLQAAKAPHGLEVCSDPLRIRRYWPTCRAASGVTSLVRGGLVRTPALWDVPCLRRVPVARGGLLQLSPFRTVITSL